MFVAGSAGGGVRASGRVPDLDSVSDGCEKTLTSNSPKCQP